VLNGAVQDKTMFKVRAERVSPQKRREAMAGVR